MWTLGIVVAMLHCYGFSTATVVRELKSNDVTHIAIGNMVPRPGMGEAVDRPGIRVKRDMFSATVNKQILDTHNEMRRREGSSDMEYMVWNDYLARMAEDWGRTCRWEHGQPYRPKDEPPYEQLGQNLYAYNGTRNGRFGQFDPIRGLELFYNETQYYSYETGACSKEPCGHYTQLVWSTSMELGCAFVYCPEMKLVELINAHYLVCNYGPAGNYIGQKPFKKGPGCSQCASGKGWCDNGLCRNDCSRQSTKCQCAAMCRNCGTAEQGTCTCKCKAGWHGVDCSEPCKDTHEWCGANPGWPVSWCDRSYVREGCPAMCRLCNVTSGTQTGDCITTTTTSTTTPTTTTLTTTPTTTTTKTKTPGSAGTGPDTTTSIEDVTETGGAVTSFMTSSQVLLMTLLPVILLT